MAPPLRYRVPAVALIVIGLGLLGTVDARVETLSQPQYTHGVVEINEEEVPGDERVRRLETFSEPAREAFLAAVNADGSHTTTTPAPDLTYPTDSVADENTYIIWYQGSLYQMTTLADGSGQGLAVAILLVYSVPAAVIVTSIGMYNLLARQPIYTAGLLAGVVAAITLYVLSPAPLGGVTPVWLTATVMGGVPPWPPLWYLTGEDQDGPPET